MSAIKGQKAKEGDKRLGNKFWQLRSKHGRDKIFSTPEILWDAACEYFSWCENNPLYEYDYKTSMKNIRRVAIPKPRPFTLQGLCLFLDVNTVYFNQFEDLLKGKEDTLSLNFSKIITRIRETIYDQKFSGAAVGLFNHNLIARDLSIKEAQEIDHKSTDGTMSPKPTITVVSDEAAKKLNDLIDANE